MANEYKNAYFYSGSGKTSLDISINGENYIFSGTAAEGTFPAIDAEGTTLINSKTNYVVENTTVTGLTKQISGKNLAIVKSTIEKNVLNGTSSGYYGIINTTETAIISESAFNENNNTQYRAIVYQASGTLLVDKTTFSNNTVGKYGILSRTSTGTTSVTNSHFTDNSGEYGAIYTASGSSGNYTVKSTMFTRNFAKGSGGAIYIHAATGYNNAFDISN